MRLRNLFGIRKPTKKVVVVMYHRIAVPLFDPWDLLVSPENFDQQISLLQRSYNVISMPQLLEFLKGGVIPERSVCLSFDDAYRDNFEVALPILQQYQLPAIFFVPGYFVEQQLSFWWDELAAIIFRNPAIPAKNRTAWKNWRWPQPPPDIWCSEFITAWEKLRPLPFDTIRTELDKLRTLHGHSNFSAIDQLPMTPAQLSHAGRTGLVSIGLHTSTHPYLPAHALAVQQQEIKENQEWVQQFKGAMPHIIAYPYGASNADTWQVTNDLDIPFGFTTQAQTITQHSTAAQLGRFQVKNWTASEFDEQLKYWMA